MRFGRVLFIAAGVGFVAPQAYAECSFDQPAGTCTGTVKLLSSGGSKPSFSAEVEITSSAGACSKVEYYVQSTPNTAIIRSDGVEHESLYSTSPITRKDMKVTRCTAYVDSGSGKQNAAENAGAKFSVDGAWHSIRDLGESGTHETTLTIKETNGKISAKEKEVAYWGPASNRRQYSEVISSGGRWTGQRNGNVITSSDGATYTIVNEHTMNASYGTIWTR